MFNVVPMGIGSFSDILRLGRSFLGSSNGIRSEKLVFRRQLAKYVERGVKAFKVDAFTRMNLALFARFFDWHDAVVLVRPATIIRWHRLALLPLGPTSCCRCSSTV